MDKSLIGLKSMGEHIGRVHPYNAMECEVIIES